MDNSQKIAALSLRGKMGSRAIAEIVLGSSSRKSTINDFFKRFDNGFEEESSTVYHKHDDKPNFVFLDLEVAPTISLTFPRWKANITPAAVIQEPYLLTMAWEFNGVGGGLSIDQTDTYKMRENTHYVDPESDKVLVEKLWQLLDDADFVIAHYAVFDTGWCNNRFAYYGMKPPSPYTVICTKKILSRYFSMPSNSLDASTSYFKLERKLDTEGMRLWNRCVHGDVSGFRDMLTYNEGDITALVDLYNKIKPFAKDHPTLSLYYSDDKMHCNVCGSTHIKVLKNKYVYTAASKFQAYECDDCGFVMRDRSNIADRSLVLSNAR